MTKIAKIETLEEPSEFINILRHSDILIYEDIQGSKIFVNWDKNNKMSIRPKSMRMPELNMIDLATQKYYSDAFNTLINIQSCVTDILDENWWFCFEYFPDNQPANIRYNRMPKNNLILSSIIKDGVWNYNRDELTEFSNLFETERLAIIFNGKLNEKQLEVIELYLNTDKKDIEYIFGEQNFSYFFYKILNPSSDSSFLMDNNSFNTNLEKIIIKINGKPDFTFEILNPLYKKMLTINNTEYSDIYSMILLKFIEFYTDINDKKKYKTNSVFKDELYIDFMSGVFNDFIKINGDTLIKWEFDIPPFFKQDKFKVNTNFINNKKTKEYVSFSDKFEYIFKCIITSFNKFKNKPIGVFNDMSLKIFNDTVMDINTYIDSLMSINKEYNLNKSDFKNFNDYFDIKFNVDAGGTLYPDVFTNDVEPNDNDKKGKSKIVSKKYNNEDKV